MSRSVLIVCKINLKGCLNFLVENCHVKLADQSVTLSSLTSRCLARSHQNSSCEAFLFDASKIWMKTAIWRRRSGQPQTVCSKIIQSLWCRKAGLIELLSLQLDSASSDHDRESVQQSRRGRTKQKNNTFVNEVVVFCQRTDVVNLLCKGMLWDVLDRAINFLGTKITYSS